MHEAIRVISDTYKTKLSLDVRPNWEDPAFRCAYVYLYFLKHSSLVGSWTVLVDYVILMLKVKKCYFTIYWIILLTLVLKRGVNRLFKAGQFHIWVLGPHNVLQSSRISLKLGALIVKYSQKRNEFLLFSIVLRSLIVCNFKTTGPIQMGFSAKCKSQISIAIKQKTENVTCSMLE